MGHFFSLLNKISAARALQKTMLPFFAVLFVCFSAAAAEYSQMRSPGLLWEDEISVALSHRDAYFSRLGLSPENRLHGIVSRDQWEQLGAQLLRSKEPNNPWYALLSGLVLAGSSSDNQNNRTDAHRYADTYFARAIELSRTSPGLLWVLFVELAHFDQHQWAQKAIRELDRLFITGGGQSAQVVAQPLLRQGLLAAEQKDYASAAEYLEWAISFDRFGGWPLIRRTLLRFPLDTEALARGTGRILNNFRNYWLMQLSVFRTGHYWLSAFLAILVIGCIAAFAFKYLTRALHGASHYYPKSIPLRIRTAYSVLLLLSVGFLGILPLLWVTVFLLWRFLSIREKVTMGIAAMLLALAPVNTRVADMLRQPSLPGNTLSVYQESLESIYTPRLQKRVRQHLRSHSEDYLAHVSAAVVALKKADGVAATELIRRAEALQPGDPVVLLTAANIAHFSNQFETANKYYRDCISMFPELEASFFNPCLYYFGEMKFIEGITLIDSASRLNPYTITSFIQKNDDYFSGDWPRLRYFLQPDYKSDYFFAHVFSGYNGDWRTADALWGNRLLGIPILPSAVISGILFILLVAMGHRAKPSGAYACKLCGVPTCRVCRKNDLCPECFERSNELRDHPMGQKIRSKIAQNRRLVSETVKSSLDVIFPGSGMVAGNRTAAEFYRGLAILGITALVYSLYYFVFTAQFQYPYWAAADIFGRILFLLMAYNVFFLLNRAFRTVKFFLRRT